MKEKEDQHQRDLCRKKKTVWYCFRFVILVIITVIIVWMLCDLIISYYLFLLVVHRNVRQIHYRRFENCVFCEKKVCLLMTMEMIFLENFWTDRESKQNFVITLYSFVVYIFVLQYAIPEINVMFLSMIWKKNCLLVITYIF